MDIEICRAEEKDFPYIKEKIKKYLLDGRNIEDYSQFFVARKKGKIVAFGRVLDHGDAFEIASLGVDYYHRKKGIGKKMLSFLVEQARLKDSSKSIYGLTHVEPFLANCGFVKVYANYPDYLDYKRKYHCKLDASQLCIMQWKGKKAK